VAESALDRIVADVRRRLDARPAALGLEEAARAAVEVRRSVGLRSLKDALSRPGPALIAECKKASPSAGVIGGDFDAPSLAAAYAAGGAAAISVVTEPDSFLGDPAWIGAVRKKVGLPILRKDFIVCQRQLFETAVLGADAVLLIARILDPENLAELLETADDLELDVLLEIFADEDPAVAVDTGTPIIGVNTRDLATFEVRLDRVEALTAALPEDRVRVAESGIHRREDLVRLSEAGYDAFLVGEYLVRADDPTAAVRELLGHGDGDGGGRG
jgi:indole-3-glycerol phosphate synthase